MYARAADSSTVCRPFHGTSVISVGPWGLSSMPRVPTDDGRCLWIADSATLSDGTTARNVAFQPDLTAPFGTCPTTSLTTPTPVVTIESGDDPSVLVQIDGGYRLAGATHVLYRIFRADPTALFGAVEVGGGVGRWDPTSQRIIIPSATGPFPWGLDLDLGDSVLAAGDGTHGYVWGCARPGLYLERGCELARLDGNDDVELFSTSGSWLPTTDASQGAVFFGDGAWMGSVVPQGGGWQHVYAVSFGATLQTDTATNITGTWSGGPNLAACDLPLADDPNSFCAGPIVDSELSDPTRPGEWAITYGVGSTAASPPGTAEDYWPRLIWAK